MPGILEADTIMVTHDGRTFATLGPVAAGGIPACRREHACRVGAGQDAVHIHSVAKTTDTLALLGQGATDRESWSLTGPSWRFPGAPRYGIKWAFGPDVSTGLSPS